MDRKKALVVGGLGGLEDWEVVALSRRSPDFETGARFVSVDLLDRAQGGEGKKTRSREPVRMGRACGTPSREQLLDPLRLCVLARNSVWLRLRRTMWPSPRNSDCPRACQALAQFTSADLHAKAMVWAATEPR